MQPETNIPDTLEEVTAEVVSILAQGDTYLLDLVDDRNRKYHIELIFPDQEPELASDWSNWRRYKTRNRNRFSLIDADLMTEHRQIAEEWE